MLWNCVKLSISFTLSLKCQISNSAVLYSDSDNRIWAWRKGNYLSSLVEQLSVCKRHFSMFNRPLVDFLQRFTVLTRQMPLGCSIMIPPHCLSAQKIVEGAGNFSSLPTKKFFALIPQWSMSSSKWIVKGISRCTASPECGKWITTAQPRKDNMKAKKLELPLWLILKQMNTAASAQVCLPA